MSPAVHTVARVHRLSVADYHRMGETGILGPDLRSLFQIPEFPRT